MKDVNAKEELKSAVQSLLNDEVKKNGLESNIKYFAKPEAAKQIAAEILKICAKKGT